MDQGHPNNANEKSDGKAKRHNPPSKWGDIRRGTLHDCFHGSWAINIWAGVAVTLVLPMLLHFFMNGEKGMIFGAAAGLTMLLWIVAFAAVRRIPKESEPPPNKIETSQQISPTIPIPATQTPEPAAPLIPLPPTANITQGNVTVGPNMDNRGGFIGNNAGTVNLAPPYREVTNEQKVVLVSALHKVIPPNGVLEVRVLQQDVEILRYANLIRDIIVEAGFDSGKIVSVGIGSKADPVGIIVTSKDRAKVEAVGRSFLAARFEVTGEVDSRIPDGEVIIVVGRRPM